MCRGREGHRAPSRRSGYRQRVCGPEGGVRTGDQDVQRREGVRPEGEGAKGKGWGQGDAAGEQRRPARRCVTGKTTVRADGPRQLTFTGCRVRGSTGPCRADLELVIDHVPETLVIHDADVNVRVELLARDAGIHRLVAVDSCTQPREAACEQRKGTKGTRRCESRRYLQEMILTCSPK